MSFGKNSISGVANSLIILVLNMILLPIIIQNIGIERYGVWVTLNVLGSWQSLAKLGFGTSLTKFISQQGIVRKSLIDVLTVTFVVILILIPLSIIILFSKGYVINDILKIIYIPKEEVYFLFTAIVLSSSLNIINNLMFSALSGLHKIYTKNIIDFTFSVINRLSLIILPFFYQSLYILGYIIFFIALFRLIISIYILAKSMKQVKLIDLSFIEFKKSLKKQFNYSKKIYTSSLINYLNEPLVKGLISNIFGSTYVAYYEIALQLKNSVVKLINQFFHPILPLFSSYSTEKAKEVLREILNVTIAILPIIIISAVFFIIPFLNIWLGDTFNQYIKITVLGISIPSLIFLYLSPIILYLLAKSHTHQYFIYSLLYSSFIGISIFIVSRFNSTYFIVPLFSFISYILITIYLSWSQLNLIKIKLDLKIFFQDLDIIAFVIIINGVTFYFIESNFIKIITTSLVLFLAIYFKKTRGRLNFLFELYKL